MQLESAVGIHEEYILNSSQVNGQISSLKVSLAEDLRMFPKDLSSVCNNDEQWKFCDFTEYFAVWRIALQLLTLSPEMNV